MRIITVLTILLLASCESLTDNSNSLDLQKSEQKLGYVGTSIDIDIDKDTQHRALAFYKKVVSPGTAANGWQATYTYKSMTGYGSSHAAARANAEAQSAGYGWIFTYSSCLSGPGH